MSEIRSIGSVLREYRLRAGMSQGALAKRTWVMRHHISDMERGKRGIGRGMAKKLANVFCVDYREFM